jgi:hypothetical protein
MGLWLLWEPAVWRMLWRRIKYDFKPLPQYSGSATSICKKIVKKCYNGKYLQVSSGHFKNFYCRDFGMCVEGLLSEGHEKYVINTLSHALKIFKKHNIITTTINSNGIPRNFFDPGVDSLPFLLRALRLAIENPKIKSIARNLRKEYKEFLEKQILLFLQWIDIETGLVKSNLKLSTMKDHCNRLSSCYSNCMSGMLSNEADKLKLTNPLGRFDYKAILIENFYNGYYFDDDMCSDYISGDANVFPFYCDIIDDPILFKSCLRAIQQDELDSPFPLRYTKEKIENRENNILPMIVAPGYEDNTIWVHLGMCFLYTIAKFEPKMLDEYLVAYTTTIVRHKNFLEVFNSNGTPYTSFFYVADDSMSWAVMYLHLKEINKSL